MPLLLVLLFPLAEIATFIVVGDAIGLFRTLALVIVSSAIGAIMLRDAGIATALKLQRQSGNPAVILAEGGSRMAAGLLLLIPGFLTDIIAVLLLIPALQRRLLARLGRKASTPGSSQTSGSVHVIDGDFRRLDGEG